LNILRATKSKLKSTLPRSAEAYLKIKDAYRNRFAPWRYAEAIFSDIYENNEWGDSESVSGRGSTLARTTVIRHELPSLLAELGVKSILDVPCGDFNWMRQIDLGPVAYVGADVVPSLISRNRQLFERDGRKFITLDITRDSMPAADVILCRDCFIHFSFRDIRAALANFQQSNSGYLFATTHTGVREHRDIATGQGRNVNLRLPPFNFPEPLKMLIEDPELTKCLGVWRLDQVRAQ
jgi:SAM-dependent methyltransferase